MAIKRSIGLKKILQFLFFAQSSPNPGGNRQTEHFIDGSPLEQIFARKRKPKYCHKEQRHLD
jgi:hypothetical protein